MTKPLPPLRRDLNFTPHLQRGQLWYAVEDPLTGRFLRLGRQEYLAAVQFDGAKNAADVVAVARAIDPALELTEEDIATLLSWLLRVGFIANPQSAKQPRTTAKPLTTKSIWDPLGARFPLIPGAIVECVANALRPLTSIASAICFALLLVVAAATLVVNWEEYLKYAGKLFVAEGRVWWIVAWLLLKLVHELGHAVTAVRAGSQIRSAGISFFFFAPVPFIDVSDLWSISNRWQRMLCSAGGILFEIAVSAIAVFVAFTAESDSLRYLACAIVTTGTITTVAFNANPFIRFDGYYILADLLQRSNLWSDGQTALRSAIKRLLNPISPGIDPIQPAFVVYGIVCAFYRFAMLMGVALWALIVWQGYGLIVIAWAVYAWFLSPFLKKRAAAKIGAQPLPGSSPTTKVPIWRQWWQPALVCMLIGVALWLPSPVQPSVPGIVTLGEPTIVRIQVDGVLTAVHVNEMDNVAIGDLIAEFDNPQLLLTLQIKRTEVAAIEEAISVLRARGEIANLQSEHAKLVSLKEQLAQVQVNVSELSVRAEVAGTVLANDLKRQLGRHFKPGEPLTMIAQPDMLEIKLSASQADHLSLRNSEGRTVRITSSANKSYSGSVEKVDMRGSDKLSEPSLAATYGGPITVAIGSKQTDDGGFKLPTPRFEVRIKIDANDSPGLVPGQLAWARIPDSATSVIGLFQRWLSKKWEDTKLENAATM